MPKPHAVHHWRKLTCWITLLGLFWQVQGQTVQVTVLNGSEIRCAVDSVVEIQIKPNPNGNFQSVSISWGDQSPVQMVNAGQNLTIRHTYNNAKLLQKCAYDCAEPIFNGFCYRLTVLADYRDISDENVSKTILFKLPPRPNIKNDAGSTACLNKQIRFSEETCPSNDRDMRYRWDFGGGRVFTTRNPNFAFDQPGMYEVKLSAANFCDSVTTTVNILVVEKTNAALALDSGAIKVADDRYSVCLGGGGRVKFNAGATNNPSTYSWDFSPRSGASWEGRPDGPIAYLNITRAGTYTVTVTTDNACQEPSRKTITLDAKSAATLSLNRQADACETISYTPNPLTNGATYTLDGNAVASFPVSLAPRDAPYIVEAKLSNECGDLSRRDTFSVSTPAPVAILFPLKDTTICRGSGEIALRAQPAGGNWQGQSLVRRGTDVFFNPNTTGDFTLQYQRGGGTCQRSASINIKVENNVALSLDAQNDECAAFSYTPKPLIQGATYRINGQVQSQFPFNAAISDQPYVVQAQLQNACGIQEKTDTFFVRSATAVQINTAPDTLCRGQAEIKLEAMPLGGTWSGTGVQKRGNETFFNPNTAGVFDLHYKIGSGTCTQEASLKMTVQSSTALTLNEQGDECTSLSYSPQPFFSQAEYRINGEVVKNFPVVLPAADRAYVVMAQLKDLCGTQEKVDSFRVSVLSPVRILNPATDTSICQGSGLLPIQVSAAGGRWLNNVEVSAAGNQFQFSPNQAGQNLLIYARGTGTCEQRDSIRVEVQAVDLRVQDQTACFNGPALGLVAQPSGGTWTSSDCPTCIQGDTFLPKNLLDSTKQAINLTYTLKNAIGCSASAPATLNISRPRAVFSIVGNACSDAPLQVDTKAAQVQTLSWQVDGRAVGNPPFRNLAAGQRRITLLAANGTCVDTSSLLINVSSPPPAADFVLDKTEGCAPLVVNFKPQATATNGLVFNWNFGRNTRDTSSLAAPAAQTYQNDTDTIVLYKAQLNIRNTCGQNIAEQNIRIRPLARARIGLDSITNQCSPLALTLTNRSTGLPETCSWDFGDGQGSNNCQRILWHRFATDTVVKTFQLVLSTRNACGETRDTARVTVRPSGIKAFFNLDDYEVCPDQTIVFRDASTPLPSRILWRFGDGSSSDRNNAEYRYRVADTSLTISLLAYSACGYDSLTRKLRISPRPKVDFTLPAIACAGQQVSLQNRSTEQASFRWDFGDGQVDSTSFSPRHLYAENLGNRSVPISLRIVDFPNGCANTVRKNLNLRARPQAKFSVSDTAGCAPLRLVFQNQSRDANRWSWDFGNGQTSSLENPGMSFDTGYHRVSLVASYEGVCLDTFSLDSRIFADPCNVYLPDAFSPNNDGNNDVFTLFNGPGALNRILDFRVFTRWGGMVYQKQNFPPDNLSGWDGTISGRPANPDTYVYVVEVELIGGKTRTFKGSVALVR